MAFSASSAFKQKMNLAVRQFKTQIIVHENGDKPEQVFTGDDAIISIKKEANGDFLRATASKLTITLRGDFEDLRGRRLTAKIGVKAPADTDFEELSWGDFTISEQSVSEDKKKTDLVAKNKVFELTDQKYISNSITYPTTIAGMIEQVANIAGVSTPPRSELDLLPNATVQITEQVYENISTTTIRGIMDELAGATGTIAEIDENNILRHKLLSEKMNSNSSFNDEKMFKFKHGAVFPAVNTITLARTPQEDNIFLSVEGTTTDQRNELKIANNELLDDNREAMIAPLLQALAGLAYHELEIQTTGFGWLDIGDKITVQLNGATFETFITATSITIDGGIKETISSTPPEKATTDYAKAGGITRTIYETQLKVDKQNRRIDAEVSERKESEQNTQTRFSMITQTVDEIHSQIQTLGGNNLIKNSVGFSSDNHGGLIHWTKTAGSTSASTAPDSLRAGAISAHQITLQPATVLTQKIAVQAGEKYTLAFRARKPYGGIATVSLTAQNENHSVILGEDQASEWQNFTIQGFTAQNPELTLKIETNADLEHFSITDLVLTKGDGIVKWTQANGEIANISTTLDENGLIVRSSLYDGDYTAITPQEFAGYSKASGTTKKVFYLNRETTVVKKLEAETEIRMPPLKVIAINEGQKAGWHFVPTSENEAGGLN